MSKAAEIFKEDGTIKGLCLVNASNNRGEALSIRLSNGDKKFTTTYTTGNDFLSAYKRVVGAVAEFHGVSSRSKLYTQLNESFGKFLASQGLKLERVETFRAVPK